MAPFLDNLQATFLIRATDARVDSSSLAAPKVTVLSGEQATFSLYDYLTYALPPLVSRGITSTISGSDTTTTTENQVYQFTVGSTLSVTPTITKDKKYVLLAITSTQQDLLRFRTHVIESLETSEDDNGTETTTVSSESYTVPETETANVMTRVSVPDGGTLVLGGHKLTQEVEKESGVPILSKIPLIGRAFMNRSKIRDAKVLLILVKPTIMLQEEREQEVLAAMQDVAGQY
jgi:type II secretory pathway component GspD/PulD (secretin)